MRRVASLCLPFLSTDRIRRAGRNAPPPDAPLAIAAREGQRMILTASCPVAQAAGIGPGMPLAQARAIFPGLEIAQADRVADTAFLTRLGLFAARRWTPRTFISGPDGIWLDLTGTAHLFGGEEEMCKQMRHACARLGLSARIAVAGTPGAAHALARQCAGKLILCPPGWEAQAIAPMPLEALRIPGKAAQAARRLGIDTVGQLLAMPRAPLRRRFGHAILLRLDQALGRVAEPFDPILPEEAPAAILRFAEPIGTADDIAAALRQAVNRLVRRLERTGLGARLLLLACDRVDRIEQRLAIGTARATRDPAHLLRLLSRRIEEIEPGYGIDEIRLTATRTEPLSAQPAECGLAGGKPEPDLAPLIDSLANRLGEKSLFRITSVESDVPERSARRTGPLDPVGGWPDWPRPVRLLTPPEPVGDVVALLPDQPPRRFTWRGRSYSVRQADGPERIHGEWWKSGREAEAVRDYFRVEEEGGGRLWLFRRGDGENGRTGDLSWYIHGVFG